MLSILWSLLMYSSTALACLHTAAHSSIVIVAKFCSASCWTSYSLKVTFFAAILVFTVPYILWGLNQDGREVAWALCVHDRRANDQLQKSYVAVNALLWDRTVCFCHVGAVPYSMLIQPQQHFTSSGIAGWELVELYIVVRRVVDHNNWFRLQIWNELLLQPFHIIFVVHVVVISTFWTRSEF